MATSGSQSRAYESTVSENRHTLVPPSTSDNDQVALAAYAAAWTDSTGESETFEGGDPTSEPSALTAAPGRSRQQIRTVGEYTGEAGITGRGVIVLSGALTCGVVLADFGLTGGLSMFFGLWFVVICLVGAMAVRRRDLFTTGVLAPLLFGTIIAVISLLAPSTFAESGGFGKVFPTGLTAHAGALVAGYGVALLTVAGRVGSRA